MSHQTGIKANDQLKKFLAKCRDGKVRAMKISIKNEQLILADHKDVKHNWEKDYDKYVIPMIEENQPCYILYRLDTKNTTGYEWLFISWSPDCAPIREKMLYASTKATMKQEFGTGQIKQELHGTVLNEITFNGYEKHKMAVHTPAPLTQREEELQELRKHESHTDYSVDSKQQTLGSVMFPLTDPARTALIDMLKSRHDYVQLKIDVTNEIVDLVEAVEHLDVNNLSGKIPEDNARYHLYRFKHYHEGDYLEDVIFIYSMPGHNRCSIKERMLYSSCKNALVETVDSIGLKIIKKLEIDDGSELTENYLYEELHPIINLNRPKFAKPKGPPNRGPKRMTKTQN